MGNGCPSICDERRFPCRLAAAGTDCFRMKNVGECHGNSIVRGDALYRVKITDREKGYTNTYSSEEAKDYINNKYSGLYRDLDGTIKAILDGSVIVAPHDIFNRVTDDEAF